MDWKKLKDNKCPQCTGSLKPNGRVLRCTKCEFLISTSKHGEIIRHLYLKGEQKHFRDIGEEENLSRLNDL